MKKFTLTVIFITATFLLLKGQERTDSIKIEKVYNLENCVHEFSMDETEPTNAGYQFWFANKDFIDGRTLKMSVVAPNSASHPPHSHNEDEFFFILEGTAKCYLEGKTKVVQPYTSFYCPSNVEHGISNVGSDTLKYLVIKKYEKQ